MVFDKVVFNSASLFIGESRTVFPAPFVSCKDMYAKRIEMKFAVYCNAATIFDVGHTGPSVMFNPEWPTENSRPSEKSHFLERTFEAWRDAQIVAALRARLKGLNHL